MPPKALIAKKPSQRLLVRFVSGIFGLGPLKRGLQLSVYNVCCIYSSENQQRNDG